MALPNYSDHKLIMAELVVDNPTERVDDKNSLFI